MAEQLQKQVHGFRVYGDNLSECQKFCRMLASYGDKLALEYQGTNGPDDIPVYHFQHENVEIGMIPCGRYEDWSADQRPSIGQEASDIILCYTKSKDEVGKPILGIEFNDAISAGNQDWQRFPRIAQAAERNVPYIYTVNIASAEVTDGEIRSYRHPNSMVQLAQLALMANYGSLSLTVYSDNPWYGKAIEDGTVSQQTEAENWEQRVAEVAISSMYDALAGQLDDRLGQQVAENARTAYRTSFRDAMGGMLIAMREYVGSDFTILNNHPIIRDDPQRVADAWAKTLIDDAELPERYRFFDWDFADFTQHPQPFKKALSTPSIYKDEVNSKLKIKSTNRKDEIEDFARSWGVTDVTTELTKTAMKQRLYNSENAEKVPVSYKRKANEIAIIGNKERFTEIIADSYNASKEIQAELQSGEGPVLLLPIAGYVQDTGGPAFSRPDKGFVRLVHEVFGRSSGFSHRVAILYSELVPNNWVEQVRRAEREEQTKLSGTNNLWRELVKFCDVVLVDVCASGKDCETGMIV